jgi:hypothetical protein
VETTGPTLALPGVEDLVGRIPPRPPQALTGSQFATFVSTLDSGAREHAILSEVLRGNLPVFLRRLAPVALTYRTGAGRAFVATIFVTPDYLAIGSDRDFLRVPMNLDTATAIASHFGFVLPTRKMVDAIYDQAAYHFLPEPLPPGPHMRSTEYYRLHNRLIEQQARVAGISLGTLVSGHKKDVVLTNLLDRVRRRLAIYGWHRPGGVPIQTLSTVHGACYADYSHGIRLVSEMALEHGTLRAVRDILQDSLLANTLSDEGPIRLLLPPGSPQTTQGRCQ